MDYRTPEELATLAEKEMGDDTHAEVADLLGVDRSAVSYALNDPGPRRIRLLARILGRYGWDVDPEAPAYPITEKGEM